MIRGHLLQLPREPVEAPCDKPTVCPIRAIGKKIVVQMLPAPSKQGCIHLPDTVSVEARPDVGVVLGTPSGSVSVRGMSVPFPSIGALVCVWPEDGIWIERADLGTSRAAAQLRVFGVFAEFRGEPRLCDWWDSIVCELGGENMSPYGDKIVLRLEPASERDGAVLLPDIARSRSGMAIVESIGPLVNGLSPGDRVCYSSDLLLQHGLRFDGSANGDYAICDERAILYAVVGRPGK